MTMRSFPLLLALALCAPALLPAQQQLGRDDATFTWSGTVPGGGMFRIRSLGGPIEVREGSGNRVEVRAEKLATARADQRDVSFQVVTDGDAVTVCSVWQDWSACDNESRNGRGNGWNQEEQRAQRVRFTVLVPRGIRLYALSRNGAVTVTAPVGDAEVRSGNGDLRVVGTLGRVRASSGNGDVEVSNVRGPTEATSGNGDVIISSATGPVRATSGNGTVEARIAQLGEGDMEFRTGNGRVRVYLPAGLNADVDASTGNGSVESDFPITIEGRVTRSRVRGTIGSGGRRLRLSSGNGRIELRRGQ